MSNKERIAISGSHGFIGSHLYDHLQPDNQVTRLSRYAQELPNTDVFIDAAAYGNMSDHHNVLEIYNANVSRVVDLVMRNHFVDYKAFLLVSTSSVTLPTQTFYSASKRAAEEFASLYAQQWDRPVVIARPYSITGVGEQDKHLIPTLIRAAYSGEKVKFVPEPVHDFLDISDFVLGIDTIVKNARDYKGRVFSLGSGTQHSNQEVLDIVEKVTGKHVNTDIVKSMRAYDTTEWQADTTLMYSLGWQPQKTLEQSITEMAKAYEQGKNI